MKTLRALLLEYAQVVTEADGRLANVSGLTDQIDFVEFITL